MVFADAAPQLSDTTDVRLFMRVYAPQLGTSSAHEKCAALQLEISFPNFNPRLALRAQGTTQASGITPGEV